MAINPRTKGQRGEYAVRDLLRKKTDLMWERVPASGALSYLKGDLYVPDEVSNFLIEVKNYEESHLNDKILTNKSNKIVGWWVKAIEQAEQKEQIPLVVFKYNRSKWFIVTDIKPNNVEKYICFPWLNCYVLLFEEWLENEEQEWLRTSRTTQK